MMHQAEPRRLDATEQSFAISTWRYLRLAMIALALGLAVAVVVEWRTVSEHCFQTSISAYYYTPARGVLVGSLSAIGVCLFCLRGSSDLEDLLMNIAGMLTPVIAMVPTPDTGSCASRLGTTAQRNADIANSVPALIAVGLFALLTLAVIARRGQPSRTSRIGYGVAAGVMALGAVVFFADREVFGDYAHDVAAFGMFGCIVAVVIFNAVAYPRATGSPRNPYTLVAGAMVTSLLASFVMAIAGFDHWVILAETLFIALFAAFWVIQTRELWHAGLR